MKNNLYCPLFVLHCRESHLDALCQDDIKRSHHPKYEESLVLAACVKVPAEKRVLAGCDPMNESLLDKFFGSCMNREGEAVSQ